MRVWKFEDNINTDFITPGRFNLTTNAKELAKIAFIEHRPEFSKEVKEGDIIVAGKNFGCGSSRETAVVALKACGVKAIFAESFARIFYRNAINQGLPLVVLETGNIDETDVVEVDFNNNIFRNLTKNFDLKFNFNNIMKKMVEDGGIINFLQKNGLEAITKL
ncbi:MAG TPA: 3-isopropylmalate dehydratase [Candidatus Bilamarchaeaceae archaeon]|nr:3-isopropylmalate dehydratase [Candidatus Bilamarchaeaceae archaeon]